MLKPRENPNEIQSRLTQFHYQLLKSIDETDEIYINMFEDITHVNVLIGVCEKVQIQIFYLSLFPKKLKYIY